MSDYSNLERIFSNEFGVRDSITINGIIAGGVVSNVYSASVDGLNAIVKVTKDFQPTYPTELTISKHMHDVDALVLDLLRDSEVRVPIVYKNIPHEQVLVMEDLTKCGFVLISNIIKQKALNAKYGKSIGDSLAKLILRSHNWSNLPLVETANSSLRQRGLELRLAYPNDSSLYKALETEFLNADDWVWADCHPKNIFVRTNGDVAFIDFGESFYGDHRYILPNYIAHILIQSVVDSCNAEIIRSHIIQCIDAYTNKMDIHEPIFCKYVAMEILHRSFGLWIEGIHIISHKVELVRLGMEIYENASSIEYILNKVETLNRKL